MSIDERKLPGLYMVWPTAQPLRPPDLEPPPGYALRTYLEGDDSNVIDLISIDGEILTEERWKEYKDRLLPEGLFLIYHQETGALVATAGAIHNPNPGRYYFPFGGELGYLIARPQHRGQGLGQIASALVVQRFLSAGYKSIRLGVQGFRLPALRTYLKVGFVPFLHREDLYPRWEKICEQIDWPYQPHKWPQSLNDI
jgi:mycothiol synthase